MRTCVRALCVRACVYVHECLRRFSAEPLDDDLRARVRACARVFMFARARARARICVRVFTRARARVQLGVVHEAVKRMVKRHEVRGGGG